MKKCCSLFFALLLLLSLSACQAGAPSSSAPGAAVALAGVPRDQVDFLTPEQWELFDKGRAYLNYFCFEPGVFVGEDPAWTNSSTYQDVEGVNYKRYVGIVCTGWDDFYRDMRTVFTDGCFETLNTHSFEGETTGRKVYLDLDGQLYHLDFTAGGIATHLGKLDRFELVSSGEDRLEFDQIAYFCDLDDLGQKNPAPKRMERGPVRMIKTEDGWRIEQFLLPGLST